jgi:hypothetical protein
MRLESDQLLQGYFWLPESEERKVPGTLAIDSSGACSLALMGFLEPLEDVFSDIPDSHSAILGVVDGGAVTLMHCLCKNRNLVLGGGVSKSSYHVRLVYLGALSSSAEEMPLSKLNVEFEGLDDWIGKTGIRVQHQWEQRSATISFEPLPDIVFKTDAFDISLTWRWTIPGGPSITESKISQNAALSIKPRIPTNFGDLQEVMFRLVNFFRLIIGEAVAIQALTATSPNSLIKIEGKDLEKSFKVFYESTGESRKALKLSSHTMLLHYNTISDRLGLLLQTWLERYETLSPAFALYFSVLSGAFTYMETRFLALSQGLETLHRRTCPDTLRPLVEFDALRNQVIENSPEAAKEWLEDRLAYANELTLRMRLKELVKPFASHFGNAKAREKFVTSVVDTRNYFTHYDAKLEHLAAQGLELHYLCERLEALFHFQLLSLAGIPTELMNSIPKKNRGFAEKLNPTGH